MTEKRRIYADHAATTRLLPCAREAMAPFLAAEFGNPSSLYARAREPRRALEAAREKIAAAIGARAEEIFFTSGGSESDNWALKGRAFCYAATQRMEPRRCYVAASEIEHHAVLHSLDFLRRVGFQTVTLPVDERGVLRLDALREFLAAHGRETAVLSVMLANNEIGTVEPLKEIAALAREAGVCMHTDAVQAVGHLPIDVQALGVDMLSASAHKFGGPRGVGFLYVRAGTELWPLIDGGAQERGRRAGTENVAGAAALAAALDWQVAHMDEQREHLVRLAALLAKRLQEAGLDFRVNGTDLPEAKENLLRLPGSLSLSFAGADGERLMHRLDLMGIEVSTGSACNSRETVVSHVLAAIHVPENYLRGTIRVTLGDENTAEDVESIASALARILSGEQ